MKAELVGWTYRISLYDKYNNCNDDWMVRFVRNEYISQKYHVVISLNGLSFELVKIEEDPSEERALEIFKDFISTKSYASNYDI